jgi:hypothetical protein
VPGGTASEEHRERSISAGREAEVEEEGGGGRGITRIATLRVGDGLQHQLHGGGRFRGRIEGVETD